MLFKNQVLGCGPSSSNQVILCYIYNVANDTWTVFSTGNTQFQSRGGVVLSKKFYFFDPTNSSIFDPASNSWTTWPVVPLFSIYSCTVVHGNSIIRFGGYDWSQNRKIFKYGTLNNSWTELNSTAPLEIYSSGCGVLPNGNILILGSGNPAYSNAYAVYNVPSDTWVFYSPSTSPISTRNSPVFSIDQRAYIVSGNNVYEFNYLKNTFKMISLTTLDSKSGHVGLLNVPSGIIDSLQKPCKGT